MAEKSKKDEAQAQFAKLRRTDDAKRATSDYEAEAVAVRAKTARLRALRLARDAAAAQNEPAAPKGKASKKKAAPAASSTLSEWLDRERKAGRHS